MMQKIKTPEEVRASFERSGTTIVEWARAHGFTRQVVTDVLHGRLKGKRGAAHKVAVLLGIKDGVIVEDEHEAD